tara:strand:+ start:1056 stop:1778 length:723 start_codon:yes stop_codon:yes gene_type:complete
MNLETIVKIIVELVLFLIASYFIFYKSWLKSLGKEIAKLSTAEDLTRIEETVKKDFKENIESYKSKLSEEIQIRIEPLKAELVKQNISHQIQYSFLHQERAKVIVELYKKLQELQSSMTDWTKFMHPVIEDGDKENEARGQRANNALFDFKDYFLLNKIFFSEAFCNPIEDLIQVYWDKGWDFGWAKNRIKDGNLPPDYFKEYSTQLTEISKELRELIPPRISDIERLCRELLNVEDEKK